VPRELIIKNTHRGLRYEDGVFREVLSEGRYVVRPPLNLGFYRRPRVEVVLVDVRQRDLTIKGQEILTADKVAIRVSIIVQFRVVDPLAALHEVENFEDRLYADVQLAARRSLASMPLEEILTNRNRLSDDILRDVEKAAGGYGIAIARADVKDLVFPGNLQEIMNRVLAAERNSEAQLVEARTRAEVQRIDAEAKAAAEALQAGARAEAARVEAATTAEALRVQTGAEVNALRDRESAAKAYAEHPALLRLAELEAVGRLALSSKANLYFGLDAPKAAAARPNPARVRD